MYAKNAANPKHCITQCPIKYFWRNNPLKPLRLANTPPSTRLRADSVSVMIIAQIVSTTPMTVSRTNTPSHVEKRKICPPMTGAKIGASPLTSISMEKNRVNAGPLQTSRAIALAMTIPAPPEHP